MVWAFFLQMVGASVAFWIIYALFALIFKHKLSLVLISLIIITAPIFYGLSTNVVDYSSLVGDLLAMILIVVFPQLQVRSEKKEAWRKAKLKKTRDKKRIKLEREKQLDQGLKKLDSVDDLKETLNNDDEKENLRLEREKVFQKNLSYYCKKVSLCEIFLLVGMCCLVFFSILTPIVLNGYKSEKSLNYEKVYLKSLDRYNKTYLEENNNNYHTNYFIYQKVNGEIKCYNVITRSTSSYEIYASKDELIKYFYDIEITSPPASFLSPVLFWCFTSFIVICFATFIISIVLFKLNEKKVINLIIKNTFTNLILPKRLINLEQKHKCGVVAEKDYKQQRIELLSKIIGNKIKFLL